ncbi:MAG: hypothetical protein OEY52_17105 [Gammaproteobacteria bacterium]|nr:hypothetical protein [Gammaproteobacteria bacterium]
MNTKQSLESRLRENPQDWEAWAVYGDIIKDEPLGKLINAELSGQRRAIVAKNIIQALISGNPLFWIFCSASQIGFTLKVTKDGTKAISLDIGSQDSE